MLPAVAVAHSSLNALTPLNAALRSFRSSFHYRHFLAHTRPACTRWKPPHRPSLSSLFRLRTWAMPPELGTAHFLLCLAGWQPSRAYRSPQCPPAGLRDSLRPVSARASIAANAQWPALPAIPAPAFTPHARQCYTSSRFLIPLITPFRPSLRLRIPAL